MPIIYFKHPAASQTVRRTLAPGEALLVGRAPDVTRAGGALDGWRVEVLALDHNAVSSNHALLWCDHDGVHLQDLGSRNGTWAKLGSHTITLRENELHVDIAREHQESTPSNAPFPPPEWTGEDDYAPRVARAVEKWLTNQGLHVEVVVAKQGGSVFGPRFMLATNEELELRAYGAETFDLRILALKENVAAFVGTQNSLIEQESGHGEDFILRSPAFRETHRRVWDASAGERRLLLLGESGTGKERLACCYHNHSARREGPFVAINCAVVDRELIYAQLFGAQRGAFTGAVREIKGAVEQANGGTLFLDEVAELDPRMQAALLRFLDPRGEYERLGDPKPRRADVRIVCATNRDLGKEIRAGRFREDLWFRFAHAVVKVPPLRERPEDLRAFLMMRREGRSLTTWDALSPEAQTFVLSHPWPGNLRELGNFVERLPAVTLAGEIERSICQRALEEGVPYKRAVSTAAPIDPTSSTQWDELLTIAASSWREDHEGADPATLGDIEDFVKAYLKPVFAAQASGVAQGARVDELNWSALGRRLAVADGTTVKRWIDRYLARFRPR